MAKSEKQKLKLLYIMQCLMEKTDEEHAVTTQEIIDYLGKDTKIYWVTVYGKYLQDQERTNGVIRQLAKDNKNVEVIAWDALGAENPDWFYNDGIHLNGAGRSAYAKMICNALGIETTDVDFSQTQTTDNAGE